LKAMSVARYLQEHVRDPFSGLSHLLTAVAAAAGTWLLVLKTTGGAGRRWPMLVFGISLVCLFSASALYHLVRGPAGRLALLRKLDHGAIFLLIAGSYTPIAALVLTGFWRPATLIIIWALGLAGITYKVFAIGARRWLYTLLYLLMGWLSIVLIGQLYRALPPGALAWLAAGGAVYTAGAVLYILKWPRLWPPVFGFHDMWHLFVIGGAFCHYLVALLYLAPRL
jgi:hemolysin III